MLALGVDVPDVLSVFDRWPRKDGLFVDGPGGVNVAFSGLAGIVLAPARDRAIARDLMAALVHTKGVAIPPSTINRQDNALRGWAWTSDTFSWVEPTATCLVGV